MFVVHVSLWGRGVCLSGTLQLLRVTMGVYHRGGGVY